MPFAVPAVSGGMGIALLAVMVIVLGTTAWVYRDAKASAGRGRPVVSSVGSVRLGTPIAWFLACLVLWEFCFPLYIDSRNLF